MSELLNSLSAVALILLMAAVGYFCGMAGWLKREHKDFLVKFIVRFCVPLMCFNNFFSNITLSMLQGAGKLFLVVVLSIAGMMGLSFLLARILRVGPAQRGGFVVMCALSNSLFVGLPMCLELFGAEATPYVMIFYIVNTTVFWTAGAFILRRGGKNGAARFSLRETLARVLNPPLVGIIVSALLLVAGFKPPQLLLSFSHYISGLVTPLSLLYVGYVIYETGLKSLRIDKNMLAMLAMRFAVSPFLALSLCLAFNITGIQRGVLTMEAAMPVMVQSVVLASSVGADESYQAAGLTLTTLACFVAVPLLMLLV
ncbi:MAG: AEC family transporter [Clostridiaceae bacterium]|nr:AEC family transporter [Eubacteriales bacterium]